MKLHKHDYRVVGVEHYSWQHGVDTTLVLSRCECGRTRSQRLEGHWSLEQLEPARVPEGAR